MGKKKKEQTNADIVISFINNFANDISKHNTAWEDMIMKLTPEELEKFARLWTPAVEYAASRMEIYRIREEYD